MITMDFQFFEISLANSNGITEAEKEQIKIWFQRYPHNGTFVAQLAFYNSNKPNQTYNNYYANYTVQFEPVSGTWKFRKTLTAFFPVGYNRVQLGTYLTCYPYGPLNTSSIYDYMAFFTHFGTEQHDKDDVLAITVGPLTPNDFEVSTPGGEENTPPAS
jgi:hypothetical protein